jgi:hypothetical protein
MAEILSVDVSHQRGLAIGLHKTRATAARASGDYRLLFHFKIFIDIFAVNPQLTRASAIAAGLAGKSTGCF